MCDLTFSFSGRGAAEYLSGGQEEINPAPSAAVAGGSPAAARRALNSASPMPPTTALLVTIIVRHTYFAAMLR